MLSKVELRNAVLEYNEGNKKSRVLDGINLNIEEDEFVCIIGPSGCGKSTLISLIAGLKFPTQGDVLIDGELVKGTGTDRGTVFQHYSLFPWLSAKNNVSFGIKQAKLCRNKKQIEERAIEFLQKVGLGEYADKYPYQLSGGMQQRVAIARTLAMDTDILLMDEPFGAIDPKNRIELQNLTVDLCKNSENRKAVIFVTHDIDEAIVMGDRIIFMEPKKIKREFRVKFPDHLSKEEIIKTKEYEEIRKNLMSLFYEEVGNQIGGEEVVI